MRAVVKLGGALFLREPNVAALKDMGKIQEEMKESRTPADKLRLVDIVAWASCCRR